MNDTDIAIWLIRISVGLTMVIYGIHQIKSPAKWLHYMPGAVRFILPVSSTTFMQSHGAINLALGVVLMSGLFAPVAACISLVWWLSITPFAFYYDWTVGVRDLVITASLLALIYLV